MPLAIYPWQEALSRDLEIFRHRMPSGIIVSGPRDIGTYELVLAFTKSLMCENPAPTVLPAESARGAGSRKPVLTRISVFCFRKRRLRGTICPSLKVPGRNCRTKSPSHLSVSSGTMWR